MATQGASGEPLRGGIDLGGTKIQAVVVSASNQVLGEARTATPTQGGPPAVTAALISTLSDAAKSAGVTSQELEGVGVGSPGSIDQASGTVSRAGNLPDWGARSRSASGCSAPSAALCDWATTSMSPTWRSS